MYANVQSKNYAGHTLRCSNTDFQIFKIIGLFCVTWDMDEAKLMAPALPVIEIFIPSRCFDFLSFLHATKNKHDLMINGTDDVHIL